MSEFVEFVTLVNDIIKAEVTVPESTASVLLKQKDDNGKSAGWKKAPKSDQPTTPTGN